MIGLTAGVTEVALVGAHCDDIAIGMGGTLLALAESVPGLRVRVLVHSGADTPRQVEEWDALTAFCPGADLDIRVLEVPDGYAPAHWSKVKDQLGGLRAVGNPEVVFGPQRADAHQDHRLIAELLPTVYRDHLVLGYEIPKWETDTPQPTMFHPLPEHVAHEKVRLLMKHYPSQTHHDWFDEDLFLGLMRLRGAQCRHRYAEGFVTEKATLSLGPVGRG